MKKISKIFLFLSILAWSLPMMAQKTNVAYVDLQYILKNLPQYETANEQLTMISKRWQKEIAQAEQEAEVLATNYRTEQIFLSEEMRSTLC